jgi:adenine-specific DNA-methyltransferase
MSSAVIKKIENILHSSYNIKDYVEFVQEIFPNIHLVAPEKFNKEFSNFSSHIAGSVHVGTFQTPDKKKIIIMAVQLKNAGYVENSRSTQRSYAKKLIENGNADAAFIAFYTEGEPKWRLSLVRLDYEIKIENGRLKTAESLTPAKRYSYLVGKDEPCHTAISRFERFITDSIVSSEHPTLDDLEEAFSVEKVTDEFFNLYCEKFHQLREQLELNEDFRIEAEQHNFTSAQFAKKLMGQIVFLYFLQKKGWLGVGAWPNSLTEKEYKNAFYARGAKSRELIPMVYRPVGDGTYRITGAALNSISDADEEVLAMCVKGKPWGSGPHDFMRRLFNIAVQRNVNFFDKLLEPLFYDALNRNRGEQGYCPALHCRIPFLSGGLFEPIDGYDWEHNDFSIPNEIFSNVAEKGRDADGILDIFDRYNFTMSEDEPMEREVAIDPEMLGKVFENLLEVNDRKSKGAFYTPREIVHYMCQESLITYLTNAMKVDEEAIRDFILYGDFMKDEDTVKDKRQGNGGMYISEQLYKINPDGTVAVNRLVDMDNALKDVRVADPAVGSGAFPLGMLNEIVRARQNISAYLAITMKPYDIRMMYQMDRSPHTLKYETIRNCIFAAVDIAQLRLWLALVIDDEINPNAQTPLDGHRNPLPLPNLESNILCGNSLVDELEGIRLVKESNLLGSSGEYQRDFSSGRFDTIVEKLIETQDELFRCDNTEKKKQLKEQIETLRDMVIMTQLEGCDSKIIERYHETKQMASKPYVLWQLDFARVFREKGGFDIVIGNPPYIDSENMVNQGLGEERDYIAKNYSFAKGNWDIYIAFFEKGFNLTSTNGCLCYITPDKWISKPFGAAMRKSLVKNFVSILEAGRDVFASALVDSIITLLAKKEYKDIKVYSMEKSSHKVKFRRTVDKAILSAPFALDIIFSSSIDLVSKIEGSFGKLGDKYVCENACATSDCYLLKEILYSLEQPEDFDYSKHYKVINTGTIGRFSSRWGRKPMKYLKASYNYPVVDITAFHKMFPNSYGNKPKKKKIIIKGLTLLDGCIDFDGIIVPGKSTMMISCPDTEDIKYLAAILNSKLMFFYVKQKYSSSSYNGGITFTKDMIHDLPWVDKPEYRNMIIEQVEKLFELYSTDEDGTNAEIIKECEDIVDSTIFEMYNITADEIKVINSALTKK